MKKLPKFGTASDLLIAEEIISKRFFNDECFYLLKWAGKPDHDSSWINEKNIFYSDKHLIEKYENLCSQNLKQLEVETAPLVEKPKITQLPS